MKASDTYLYIDHPDITQSIVLAVENYKNMKSEIV